MSYLALRPELRPKPAISPTRLWRARRRSLGEQHRVPGLVHSPPVLSLRPTAHAANPTSAATALTRTTSGNMPNVGEVPPWVSACTPATRPTRKTKTKTTKTATSKEVRAPGLPALAPSRVQGVPVVSPRVPSPLAARAAESCERDANISATAAVHARVTFRRQIPWVAMRADPRPIEVRSTPATSTSVPVLRLAPGSSTSKQAPNRQPASNAIGLPRGCLLADLAYTCVAQST